MHETGHTLGLAHPHQSKYPMTEDHEMYGYHSSVMAYNRKWDDLDPSTFMPWDIAKLQDLYGINRNHNAGNTVYKFNPDAAILRTVWDGDGIDIIDASDVDENVSITLWEGVSRASHIGDHTVHLAYGANIENAIGGSDDDTLTGNRQNNRLTGNGDNDSFEFRDLKEEKTDHLGDDVITDFHTSLLDLGPFGAEEDRIIVGKDVGKAVIYQGKTAAVIYFEDRRGVIIPGTSVKLENFSGDGRINNRTDDIDIYRTKSDGKYEKLDSDEIIIKKGPPPKISENGIEDLKGAAQDHFTAASDPALASADVSPQDGGFSPKLSLQTPKA